MLKNNIVGKKPEDYIINTSDEITYDGHYKHYTHLDQLMLIRNRMKFPKSLRAERNNPTDPTTHYYKISIDYMEFDGILYIADHTASSKDRLNAIGKHIGRHIIASGPDSIFDSLYKLVNEFEGRFKVWLIYNGYMYALTYYLEYIHLPSFRDAIVSISEMEQKYKEICDKCVAKGKPIEEPSPVLMEMRRVLNS